MLYVYMVIGVNDTAWQEPELAYTIENGRPASYPIPPAGQLVIFRPKDADKARVYLVKDVVYGFETKAVESVYIFVYEHVNDVDVRRIQQTVKHVEVESWRRQ